MNKLVSAIITTHNRLELLKRAIDSVLNQSYPNIECIVVSDASTDGTNEYCKTLPIHYISIPIDESHGGNYARNVGIKAAKGKYIAFLDDDDYWKSDKIVKQVELIEKKDCGMVHCGRTNEIVMPQKTIFKNFMPTVDKQGDLHRYILTNICTTTSCMLVKKEILEKIGMFDENLRFWQEYDLTIRLAQCTPIYYVNEALTVYRIDKSDPNRLTNKYTEWLVSVNYVHEKYKDLYKQLNFVERQKAQMLVWRDAAVRCRAAGFTLKYYLYGFKYIATKYLVKLWQ